MSAPALITTTRAAAALLLAWGLCAPPGAQAATFKCTVDGKTVYQQSPCAGEPAREAMKLPGSGGPGGTTYTASEVAKLRDEVQNRGHGLAREAWQQLLAGQVDVYVANLCPRERQSWSNPQLKGSLKSMGALLAKENMRFGRQTDATQDSLSFTAFQEPFPTDGRPPRTRTLRAHFGRELGQLCLRVLDIGA